MGCNYNARPVQNNHHSCVNKMFEIRYEDAKQFKAILKLIQQFSDEPTWKINEKGMFLRTLDPARVSMIDLKIPQVAFDEYRASKRATKICFDLEWTLKTSLKKINNHEMIVLRHQSGKQKDKLNIALVDGNLERGWIVSLLELPDEQVPKKLGINLTAKVTVLQKTLETIITDAEATSDHIKIVASRPNCGVSPASSLNTES